ncbi:MAG TPA: Ig-like domain-containing protein, partial [Gaiellaceae bacterium]|nr:Ig-like domain-containing protein [Gaiellaceae bacterium]
YTWAAELLRGVDPFGLTGSQPSIRVDGTAPVVTIQQKPSDPSGSQSATFAFTVSEQASVTCKLDGGDFAPCTSPVDYSNLVDGIHSFTARAVDSAGNVGDATYSWRVDATAPAIAITEKPSDPSNSTSAAFAFTASEAATECKLDDAAFVTCSSPITYADLAQGPHTFTVRATDSVGNADQDTYTWTVDSIPPTVAITGGKPSDPTNSRSATFTFTASEPTQCRLDDGVFAGCTSPKAYNNLADGPHTFTVKATDTAGNTSQDAHTWTVDATPPTVAITGGEPANPTNSSSASFTFTASDATQCKLDSGAFAPCISPAGYLDLPDGSHTFTVKATDTAGNTAEDSYTWVVDTTAPTVTIVGGPAALSNTRSPSFTFTTTDPAQCKLDDGAFTACTSPKGYSNLPDGQHTFTLKAIDAAGNTSQDAYTWTIDATPPTVSIGTGPDGLTNSRSAVFTFTASDSTQCKLDTGEFVPCSSPAAYDNLPDGPHSFTVRAIDAAQNSAEATRTWTVDGTPPTVQITGDKPGDPTNSTSATFTFSSSEASTFACKLDTGSFAACISPKSYTSLGDGQHVVTIRATDLAGNSSQDAYTWTVDSQAPTVAIVDQPPNATQSRTATFAFTADAATQCKLDGAAFVACTSPTTYSGLADGTHAFTVQATDNAGNTGQDAYAWTVDNAAPSVIIVQKPTDPSDVKSPAFAFTFNEGTAQCKLDAGAFSACASPKSYTNLNDGQHTFTVRSTDAAGNTGQDSYTWRLETQLAVATLVVTPRDPSTDTSARFEFRSRTGATFECSLDGAAFAACTSPAIYGGLAQGPHSFAVRAKDGAGTGPSASYSWRIDSLGPSAAITQAPGSLTSTRSATFGFTANEAGSFACQLDGAGFGPCASPVSYQGIADGTHTFTVRPTDVLGNVGAPVSYGWRVDGTAPETTLASAPSARTTLTSATFTFSADEPAAFQCKLDAAAFAPCVSPKPLTGLRRTAHIFEVRAIDAAGNVDPTPAILRWTILVPATRRARTASALLAPRAGARVTSPPLLRWRRVPRASYYNVQLRRGSVKVLSAWPTRTRLQLRARWTYLGRERRLTPGTYRWYVWPGYGKPAQRRYGRVLGSRTFTVRARAGR